MAQEQKNTTFGVMLDTEGTPEYHVTAAYTSVDERMFPGWVLLKDEHGVIVAKVRSNRTLMIRRQDSNPHAQPKQSSERRAIPPAAVASPSHLARLQDAHGKPGTV